MVRDLERVTAGIFDTVVIGGGVYGAAAARELAGRGFSVAVVERGDFAAATSFNSLKTIHGGIRALQHGSLTVMREFVRERRGIAAIAPHLVRVLPFVIPTTRRVPRNPAVMRAFLSAYDLLSADRNDGIDPSRRLPPSRVISRNDCLHLNPWIDPAGVTGGALWHDYQLHSPERFAMGLLQSAVDKGAATLNYAEVQALIRNGRQIIGIRARDLETGVPFDIRARVVVNAAGPWAAGLLERLGTAAATGPRPAWSLAMNVVLDRPAPACAAGGLARGRFLFLVPWQNQSIVGTSHDRFRGDTGVPTITGSHVDAFLADAVAAFPGAGLNRDAVRLVHRGLLPAPPRARDAGALLKRSIIHDHAADGLDGLITVIGVRYTTARATAAAVAERVARKMGLPASIAEPMKDPLPGGHIADLEQYESQHVSGTPLDSSFVRRLIAAYGTNHEAVSRLLMESSDLASPLGRQCAVTRAEILYSVRSEMALHLTDALLRRTAAGAGGHPGTDAVQAAADVMANELSWTPAQTAREIEDMNRVYAIPDRTD